jgi:hypothetical protein
MQVMTITEVVHGRLYQSPGYLFFSDMRQVEALLSTTRGKRDLLTRSEGVEVQESLADLLILQYLPRLNH